MIRASPVCVPADPSDKAPSPSCSVTSSTHTSGLPDQLPFTLGVEERCSRLPRLHRRVALQVPTIYRIEQPIGFDHVHSDLGMVLLGHVIQRKTGQTIGFLVSEGGRPARTRFQSPANGDRTGVNTIGKARLPSAEKRPCRSSALPAIQPASSRQDRAGDGYMHTPGPYSRTRGDRVSWHCRTFEGTVVVSCIRTGRSRDKP